MGEFRWGYKQYLKTTPSEILGFLKTEKDRVSPSILNDFDSLTAFDLREQLCFKLLLDNRVVGIACAKWINGDPNSRRLTKIYVTPSARKRGCATHLLQGLKIAQITIPVHNVEFVGLCRRLGFSYCQKQDYPTAVAQLQRRISE